MDGAEKQCPDALWKADLSDFWGNGGKTRRIQSALMQNAKSTKRKGRLSAGPFRAEHYILEMMSTISAPMRFCASTVAAPMCGVQETMGWE